MRRLPSWHAMIAFWWISIFLGLVWFVGLEGIEKIIPRIQVFGLLDMSPG